MTLQQVAEKMKRKRVPVYRDCTFENLTTLGCGGKIYLTLRPKSLRQLVFVARYLLRHKIKHCFLGNGSNVLASDNNYNGVVVVTTSANKVRVFGKRVVAACGASTAKVSTLLCKHGLDGGQFLGCIPATVGGAVVCNAGCFGQSCQQVVRSVWALHCGKLRRYGNKKCAFQKRNSLFKNNGDFVILWSNMSFGKTSPQQVQKSLTQMRQTKAATQPIGARSAGCVLYHPQFALSQLIDRAGLKGYRIGGAKVSEKHAGFILNLDKATARDIYLLLQYVKNTVAQKFGVTAQVEICLVNFPPLTEQG